MADVRALVRVVDELLWSLRREGFVVSTAQAVDVARAVREVGLEQREHVRAAVGAIVVQRARERARYESAFDAFFDAGAPDRRTLWERLASAPWGFSEAELQALRELLGQISTT